MIAVRLSELHSLSDPPRNHGPDRDATKLCDDTAAGQRRRVDEELANVHLLTGVLARRLRVSRRRDPSSGPAI
jgi:hypothetical protein